MFSSGSNTGRGSFLPTAPAVLLQSQSLKRRRRSGGEEEQLPATQFPAETSFSTKKPRREQKQHTFQLSFLTAPTVQDTFSPYNNYQPTPPIDSDSDSSSDQFAMRFAASVPVQDDDVMMDEPEQRVPRVVIGPPTPVTEVMERLDVSGDVDMDRRQEGLSAETGIGGAKKKSGLFRMGFRGDCEKCRLRVPGHYSHY